MKTAKQIVLYICWALALAIWAMIVEGFASLGSPAYLVQYPAARLCNSLKLGMELADVEARIYRLGIPNSITYRNGQVVIFSLDSGCIVDIDPNTKRVAKISTSGAPYVI